MSSSRATSSYLLITLAMTWPLLPGLARDVPGDLGDSLLNMWILGWGAENVPRVLTGRMSLTDFWNANIFHPEPLTLSLSEHLFGQVIQILPVYHLTKNLILSYNLLYLSSIFLSAVAMYLLVADLLFGSAYRDDVTAHVAILKSGRTHWASLSKGPLIRGAPSKRCQRPLAIVCSTA